MNHHSRQAALVELFERRGCTRVETPILQPAGLFLDLSGESVRRRLYLTQDNAGGEFCLRPEHTIPVCLHHLASGRVRGDYSYLGPVFRQRGEGTGEFLQAGFESFGRADEAETDADVLSIALDGVSLFPAGDIEVTVGDMGLIEALLVALAVPPAAQRRLTRRLSSGRGLDHALSVAVRGEGHDYAGLLAAIEGQDAKAARSFVEDVISIAGIARVGGRSAGEIAERFLQKAANRSAGLPERASDVLRTYFTISGPLGGAARQVRSFARDAGLDLSAGLDGFERRTDLIAARGVDVGAIRFAAEFSRNFDYYSGLVFDMRRRGSGPDGIVATGGRYDDLVRHLGSPAPSPAIGCSFWLDRLEGMHR